MFAMFNSLFRMFTMLFSTGENFGMALNSLSNVAKSMADEYAQISDLERKAKIAAKMKELGYTETTVEVIPSAKAKTKAITTTTE